VERRRPVQAADPGAARAGDGIGDDPVAVVAVEDVDLLVGPDVGLLEELLVERDAPLVVEAGLGDREVAKLGLAKRADHAAVPPVTAAS
jgi:hypothetical protein